MKTDSQIRSTKGIQKGKLETAKNMLKKELPTKLIQEMAGLTRSTIRVILKPSPCAL